EARPFRKIHGRDKWSDRPGRPAPRRPATHEFAPALVRFHAGVLREQPVQPTWPTVRAPETLGPSPRRVDFSPHVNSYLSCSVDLSPRYKLPARRTVADLLYGPIRRVV